MSDQTLGRARGGADKHCVADHRGGPRWSAVVRGGPRWSAVVRGGPRRSAVVRGGPQLSYRNLISSDLARGDEVAPNRDRLRYNFERTRSLRLTPL